MKKLEHSNFEETKTISLSMSSLKIELFFIIKGLLTCESAQALLFHPYIFCGRSYIMDNTLIPAKWLEILATVK